MYAFSPLQKLTRRFRWRYLAAIHYSGIGLYLLSSWYLLFAPFHRVRESIEIILAQPMQQKMFFAAFAMATALSALAGVAWWFPKLPRVLATILLPGATVVMLGLAVWQFNLQAMVAFGLGAAFAAAAAIEHDVRLKRPAEIR